MPRVLYGISPIGLGHATRSMVIIERLLKQGAEVKVFSGGKAAEFLKGLGAENLVDDAVPSVDGLEMNGVTLWYVRSWLAQRRNLQRARRLVDSYKPDVVVGDEEFSGVTAAGESRVKRVFISDELDLGFARGWLARKVEGRVERWYKALQASVDLLLIPEDGTDQGNRRYLGPIVRAPTMTPDEVRKLYSIPRGRMVLFSMSGSGIGNPVGTRLQAVLQEGSFNDVTLVVTGNRREKFQGENVLDLGVVPDNQDLVASADLVVSTAGKSTIDEAAAAGTPVVAVPIRHHVEQERNARALGYGPEALQMLGELVAQKIGRREPPRKFGGEEKASQLILSLV